jgi:hypothetical protein
MTGIQFVTDEKGRRTAVLIDLRKRRAIWEDFWDGLVSESRRKQKGIPYEEYRAKRLKHEVTNYLCSSVPMRRTLKASLSAKG